MDEKRRSRPSVQNVRYTYSSLDRSTEDSFTLYLSVRRVLTAARFFSNNLSLVGELRTAARSWSNETSGFNFGGSLESKRERYSTRFEAIEKSALNHKCWIMFWPRMSVMMASIGRVWTIYERF